MKEFDIQKARAATESLLEYYRKKAEGYHPECEPLRVTNAAEMLPAALDRIEELEAALIEERARRICHAPTDTVGHWPVYEETVVDEAKIQLHAEGRI